MIIITMNNGVELKYKGKIELYIDSKFFNILCVTAEYSKNSFGWSSETWDNIFLEDIKSIKGIWND